MLKELIQVRNDMLQKLDAYSGKSQYENSRATLKEIILNFDKHVLGAYVNSNEVNTKLLEELKFYEK